jgi:uroporphyrinogen-III synthase
MTTPTMTPPIMTPSLVITTRPIDDARDDCAQLAEDHITCLPAPMLEIIPLDADLSMAEAADAVVLTSRHAAGLLSSSGLCHLPCYCVGSSTAAQAKASGFNDIIIGPGDGGGLAAMIAQDQPQQVFWPSAVDTGFNMEGALASHGIKIARTAVYRAATTESLSQDVIDALIMRRVAAVLIHSGRAGAHFCQLLDSAELTPYRQTITAIVISPRAARLCGDNWRNIIVAKAPRRAAIFDALRGMLQHH